MRQKWLLFFVLLLPSALACGIGPPAPTDPAAAGSADDDSGYAGTGSDDGASGDDDATGWVPSTPPPEASASPSGDDATTDAGASDGATAPGLDATPAGACATPPAAGDLLIDELMIESVAGTGDYGEWLEVRSTRSCAINLRGLHGECPSGAKVRTFDVTEDTWLPSLGTFVVADTLDPAINHDLPGLLIEWAGRPGDVLRNKGATVSLLVQDTLVDSVTYPALKLVVGASTAFPADCPPSRRSDWTAWQTSSVSWFPGFLGSPNAPNIDVRCP
jgi:hypothetical protein